MLIIIIIMCVCLPDPPVPRVRPTAGPSEYGNPVRLAVYVYPYSRECRHRLDRLPQKPPDRCADRKLGHAQTQHNSLSLGGLCNQ